MRIYVGYGFDTNDVPNEAWAALVKKYDHELWESKMEDIKAEADGAHIIDPEVFLTSQITEVIDDEASSCADYLRDLINAEEKNAAGTDYIVSSYDQYLVFDSIRFADDSPRTRYIRNESDFVRMIGRYVPTDKLTFGSLYEGGDWMDPSYSMD